MDLPDVHAGLGGAFLLGLWCGWMWCGRRLSARVGHEAGTSPAGELMDWAMVALFVLVLALISLGILALSEGYLPGAMTRIVTSTYRYKRPPRKRKPNPAALAMRKDT